MNLKNLALLFFIQLCFNIQVAAQSTVLTQVTDSIGNNETNDQKVVALAQFLSKAIDSQDTEKFISKFDQQKFFDLIFESNDNINREHNYVKGFVIGMKQSMSSFPEEIIAEIENGAYYDFINYHYDDTKNTYYAMFRLYSSETGINYHNYRLSKNGDEFKFCDIYIYLSGEHFTETLSRMMSYSIPEDAKLNPNSDNENDTGKKLLQATLFNKMGQYEKAYKVLDAMEPPLRNEKFLLIFKSLIASNFSDNLYLQSIEELINTYPDDPTIYLNKIDYLFYKGQYFEAIQAVNSLQDDTQDDFLNFLKATIALEDENYDLALNFYKYIIDNYQGFFDAQAGYLTTLVLTNNYGQATEYLDTLIEEGYEKPWLIEFIEMDDEFGENVLKPYADSENFKEWKANKN